MQKKPAHKSIWQVPEKYHVSIFALCLSEHEVSRLTGRGTGGGKDYCLPSMLVTLAKTAGGRSCRSMAIQQVLDEKFRLSLIRLAVLETDDEIRASWHNLLKGGEFRGAYWAIMTHPRVSAELVDEVYQQLNIYSLQNCCVHVQQKRLCCELQRKVQSLDGTLVENQQRHRLSICGYCSQIAQLKSELQLAEHHVNRLQRHLELFRFRDGLAETT